jgi:ABC-type Fe3+ transport system permease subunit
VISSFRSGHPAAPGPFTISNYLVAYTNPLTYRMIFNTAWLWVAAHAVRAFSVPLMLASRDSWPLSVMLWHLWDEEQNLPAAAALGVVLILVLTILTLLARVVVAKGFEQT